MRIWSQTIVKNEEKWIWYSLTSAMPFVEKMLVWDTGSTDKTQKIIKDLIKKHPGKIDFREVGNITKDEFTSVRQRMLERTKADWFLVLDADEVWWNDSLRKVTDLINRRGNTFESIAVPTINLVGDIFHYQEKAAGRYKLAGRSGHLSLRFVNTKIPGLHSKNPHGTWGWVDSRDRMIQDRGEESVIFVDAPYLHFTFLPRGGSREKDLKTPKRAGKLKYEVGNQFPRDFYYPEAFFSPRPKDVPSPWTKMDNKFFVRSLVETPLRKIKRRISFLGKTGY